MALLLIMGAFLFVIVLVLFSAIIWPSEKPNDESWRQRLWDQHHPQPVKEETKVGGQNPQPPLQNPNGRQE